MKKHTKDTFIEKAKEKHGDIYDYSLVDYKTNKVNVLIICKDHGVFTQMPLNHLKGTSCPACNNERRPTYLKSNTDEFINKAIKVHGDKYDYKQVNYTGNRKPVVITCKIHGDFTQKPVEHLSGCGCQKCNKSNKLSSSQITDRLGIVHTTDKLKFFGITDTTSTKSKIGVECKLHGIFYKRLEDLLVGQGCPKCKTSGYSKSKPGTFYLLHITGTDFYKVGITNKTVSTRYSLADQAKFTVVKEIFYEDGLTAALLEQHVLKKYKQYQYKGPSLLASGNTEILYLHQYTKDLLLWDLSLF